MCSVQADYPFFTTVNRVINGELPPSAVVEYRKAEHHVPANNIDDNVDALVSGDTSVALPV